MRLVLISNRLPFTVTVKDGKPRFKESPGGLTTGLWSYLERAGMAGVDGADFLWIGWPGSTIASEHHEKVAERARKEYKAHPVFLAEEAMERFYHGFCNATIWPLFHYFPTYTTFDEECWREYQQVNQAFYEAVRNQLQPEDVVWVHDYQLMLLPRLIREHYPTLPIGFFLHIPFPSFELFQLLPSAWRREILEGLLGASLIGFHTHDYTRHFLSCAVRTLGREHQLGRITLRDRVVKVDTFPMGIDFDKFHRGAQSADCEERMSKLREKFAGLKVIFSVDRLDYTKGLIKRLQGYDLFLAQNPQWHGKVVLVLVISPSRTGVETYQAMKREIDEWVGRIHGAYGSIHWTPILYQYRNMSFPQLVSMFRFCDVALVTPLRDGMNLVAKEFLASRTDQTGVLILSEMAGAAKEMGEALVINPFHYSEIAEALAHALSLSIEEQRQRNLVMQERLRRYNVLRWAEEFVHALQATESTQMAAMVKAFGPATLATLRTEYAKARQRGILLDYDGTLRPFVPDPQQARPDSELVELLGALASDRANQVVIISGRPRADLDQWLGALPLGLIAEHGVWHKAVGQDWRQLRAVTAEWKTQVRPILQLYVDRLPGALLEEKEYSLAWHYRRADPDQGSLRAKELLDDLADFTRNIDVQVLEGNKVIEIRNAGVNKGAAALEWRTAGAYDFILAFGDDWTDEDMFRALPPEAFSVRVGLDNTAARFRVPNAATVREILRQLIRTP
ncbi:MAG: bifunctional alpha,alpha-trehalose-phosphate synthase (UDP-forming)/trehalose-phosphatase [Verrucomicrobia bacterium]|nr:bifunctional alpha,alpha-trehalose-phosphate synthase (UDP-forming)/trehalose-phosphatase [Verrucomicrobiota bacterium]